MKSTYLGLDVGNSRLSAAIVTPEGQVRALARVATPKDADAAVDRLLKLARQVMTEDTTTPEGVGIGFGGPVDVRTGRVRTSFLSSGWEDLPLAEIIARRLGIAAFLGNDADAGGLAEALFGAGRGARSMLYVNVGTGIGGAVILDGRLHTGATSSAGEIGHFIVVPDGPLCECGKQGCAQALSSGTALARRAREMLNETDRLSTLRALSAAELSGRAVGEAAVRGDRLAVDIVAAAAGWLGIALANAIHLLDPECVVVGGGVAEMGEVFWGPLRASVRRHLVGPAADSPLVPAQLGYDAGVIGAAALAMTEQGARSDP